MSVAHLAGSAGVSRKTTAQRLAMTPAKSSLLYDTDTLNLYVGDSVTAGGQPAPGSGAPVTGVLHSVGNVTESADGPKTFTGPVMVPTAAPGTSNNQAASTAFVMAGSTTTDALVVHKAGDETITGIKKHDNPVIYDLSVSGSAIINQVILPPGSQPVLFNFTVNTSSGNSVYSHGFNWGGGGAVDPTKTWFRDGWEYHFDANGDASVFWMERHVSAYKDMISGGEIRPLSFQVNKTTWKNQAIFQGSSCTWTNEGQTKSIFQINRDTAGNHLLQGFDDTGAVSFYISSAATGTGLISFGRTTAPSTSLYVQGAFANLYLYAGSGTASLTSTSNILAMQAPAAGGYLQFKSDNYQFLNYAVTRFIIRMGDDGTNPTIGFLGAGPISRPSGDIFAALSNLGLVSSPTLPGKADDSLVVHKAGTEEVTGPKTFSGAAHFTGLVDVSKTTTGGQTTFDVVNMEPTSTSLNQSARIRLGPWSGFAGTNFHPYIEGVVDMAGGAGVAIGTYAADAQPSVRRMLIGYDGKTTFTGPVFATTAAPGTSNLQLATTEFVTTSTTVSDALVVHKAGAENIPGVKTFTTNMIINGVLNLGTPGIFHGRINSNDGLYINTDSTGSGTADGSIIFAKGRPGFTGGTEFMRIASNGQIKMGAGTASGDPNSGLDVSTGVNTIVYSIGTNLPSFKAATIGGATTKIQSGPGIGIIGTESNHPLTLYTNNLSRITIDTGGTVTIPGILAPSEIWMQGFNFSKLAHINGNPYLGYNFTWDVTDGRFEYLTSGALGGIGLLGNAVQIFAGNNAAAGAQAPLAMSFSETSAVIYRPLTINAGIILPDGGSIIGAGAASLTFGDANDTVNFAGGSFFVFPNSKAYSSFPFGVGTNAPARIIHAKGTSNQYIRLEGSGSGSDVAMEYYNGTNKIYEGILGGSVAPGAWGIYFDAIPGVPLAVLPTGNMILTACPITFQAPSTTTANQPQSKIIPGWADNTHATRKGRVSLKVVDYTGVDKEAITIQSDGNKGLVGVGPIIGFGENMPSQLTVMNGDDPNIDVALWRRVITTSQKIGAYQFRTGAGGGFLTSEIRGETGNDFINSGDLVFSTSRAGAALADRMRLDSYGNAAFCGSNGLYHFHVGGTPKNTVFCALSPASLADADNLIYANLPAVTGSVNVANFIGSATTGMLHRIVNGATVATAHTVSMLSTVPTGGDPTFNWNIATVTNWQAGIDNSDGDKWKLSADPAGKLETSTVMTADPTTLAVTFSGGVVASASGANATVLDLRSSQPQASGNTADLKFFIPTAGLTVPTDPSWYAARISAINSTSGSLLSSLAFATNSPHGTLADRLIIDTSGNVNVTSKISAVTVEVKGVASQINVCRRDTNAVAWSIYSSAGDLGYFAGAGDKFIFKATGTLSLCNQGSTGAAREQALIVPGWVGGDNTEATRKGQLSLQVADYTFVNKEAIRIESDGTYPITTTSGVVHLGGFVTVPTGLVMPKTMKVSWGDTNTSITYDTSNWCQIRSYSGGGGGGWQFMDSSSADVVRASISALDGSAVFTGNVTIGPTGTLRLLDTGSGNFRVAGTNFTAIDSALIGFRDATGATNAFICDTNTSLNTSYFPLQVLGQDTSQPALIVRGAAGYGTTYPLLLFQGASSTAPDRNMGAVNATWADSTDASRRGRLGLAVCDATGSEKYGLLMESNGTDPDVFIICTANEPSITTFPNSSMNFWLDNTGKQLHVTVKFADGTTKTGQINLS